MHRRGHRRLVAAAIVLCAVPWIVVGVKLHGAKPIALPAAQPTSVVWADRVFSSAHDLKAWLTAHGASYDAWVAAHPNLAAILEPTSVRRRHQAGGTAGGVNETASAGRAAPRKSSGWRGTVEAILIDGLGLLISLTLLAFAVAPGRALALVRPGWENLSVEVRVSAFAGAVSVGAGVFVGRFIG